MKTIYIVEDDCAVRHGLKQFIGEQRDMSVCGEAKNVASAMAAVGKSQPDIVLVESFTDGVLVMDFIKYMRCGFPKTKVLVLAMACDSELAIRFLRAGARAYISKRETMPIIVDAIRQVCNGRIYLSSCVEERVLGRLVTTKRGLTTEGWLSDRELVVVNLIGSGLETREIADKLHLSEKTVETHRAHIKTKFGLANATQLVRFCVLHVENNLNLKHTGMLGRKPRAAPERVESESQKGLEISG